MDALRASPLLRNRRSDAFGKLRQLARRERGPHTDDVALHREAIAEPASSEVKLHVRGISKRYGTSTVLKPLELKVFAGELLAILGPSGSGKTTLLQIICGLVEPSAGRLMIDGNDETDIPADKRDVGVVFQNYALFPHLTVRENIAFPLQMRRASKDEIRSRVEATLAMVGLTNFGERFPLELSGGQQQRVALARCFVYRPSLILMDESLSALDKKLRDSMRIEIKRLHRETGATIIFVTHDQEEALALSDRICLMNDGHIEQLGTPEDIYERPANTFVADFIGASNLIFGTMTADGRMDSTEGVLPLPGNCAARAGQEVALVVRPEKLMLCSSNDGRLSGKVEESVYAGAQTKLLVRLPGGSLMTVRRDAGLPPVAIGEHVYMCWDQNQARLLEGRPIGAVV
jgi:putative spermidine/putrescine transport system ATP-binding protein